MKYESKKENQTVQKKKKILFECTNYNQKRNNEREGYKSQILKKQDRVKDWKEKRKTNWKKDIKPRKSLIKCT